MPRQQNKSAIKTAQKRAKAEEKGVYAFGVRGIDLLHGEKRDNAKFPQYAEEYLSQVEVPIVSEFANALGMTGKALYDLSYRDELVQDVVRMISDQKQIKLERGALTGRYNPTMSIFSLKQMGWKDKVDFDARIEAQANPLIEAIREAATNPAGDGGYSGGIEC